MSLCRNLRQNEPRVNVFYAHVVRKYVMLTTDQIRAARALLRWSAAELATRSSLSERTLQRMEAVDGVPAGLSKNLELVQRALEDAGVFFIDEDEELGPGVRLRRSDTVK